jgi:hypothetical protein
MRFLVLEVKRSYGPNGWQVTKQPIAAFDGLNGFAAAAQEAANLALVGRVIEIWGAQDTLDGQDNRLVAVVTWWGFKRGATSITYDTDYLDTDKSPGA